MASQGCDDPCCQSYQSSLVANDDDNQNKMEIDTSPQSTKCHYKSIGYTCGNRIDLPYIKHKLASCMVKEGANDNVECGNLCTYQEIYQYHGPCYRCSTGMVHAFWKLVDTEDEKQWEDLEKYIGGMSLKD